MDLSRPISGVEEGVETLGAFGELVGECLCKRKEQRLQSVQLLVERLKSLTSGGHPGQNRGAPARHSRDIAATEVPPANGPPHHRGGAIRTGLDDAWASGPSYTASRTHC